MRQSHMYMHYCLWAIKVSTAQNIPRWPFLNHMQVSTYSFRFKYATLLYSLVTISAPVDFSHVCKINFFICSEDTACPLFDNHHTSGGHIKLCTLLAALRVGKLNHFGWGNIPFFLILSSHPYPLPSHLSTLSFTVF